MQRVSVVGSSGSGKSTLARRLAAALEVPYVELDELFWGPDWSGASVEELTERVTAAIGGESWVIDGNYQSKLGTLVWTRADTIVWTNPSRARATLQILVRTIRRAATGEELWNGNRETWKGLRFWRGEDSILWWSWTTYGRTRDRYLEAMQSTPSTGPAWHRLRSRRDVERFLRSVSPAEPGQVHDDG